MKLGVRRLLDANLTNVGFPAFNLSGSSPLIASCILIGQLQRKPSESCDSGTQLWNRSELLQEATCSSNFKTKLSPNIFTKYHCLLTQCLVIPTFSLLLFSSSARSILFLKIYENKCNVRTLSYKCLSYTRTIATKAKQS